MPTFVHTRSAVVAVIALVALAGCSGDDPVETAEDIAADVADDATDEIEDVADDAQEALDDSGVDTAAGGTAEAQLLGRSYLMEADESFGCFLTRDGGSQGAISFSGEDDEGNRLTIDWAGDSPDAAVVSLELADGTEWTTPFDGVEVDVVLTPPSAVVTAGVVSLADGAEADLLARPMCGM